MDVMFVLTNELKAKLVVAGRLKGKGVTVATPEPTHSIPNLCSQQDLCEKTVKSANQLSNETV